MIVNRSKLSLSEEEIEEALSRPTKAKFIDPAPRIEPITEESFDDFINMAVQYDGSEYKIAYMGPTFMRDMRWSILNRAFRYRRGKSGKLIVRKGDMYDSYMDWKEKGLI